MKRTFDTYTKKEIIKYVQSAKELELIIAEHFNLDCHLGFGSLLGAVREGGVIKTDYDIDLCFLIPQGLDRVETTTELFDFLMKNGLLKRVFYKNGTYEDTPKSLKKGLYGQAHVQINDHIIDLFATWTSADKYYTCQWGELGDDKGMAIAQLENNTFKIPADYDNILTKLYGDWGSPSQTHPSKFLKRQSYL